EWGHDITQVNETTLKLTVPNEHTIPDLNAWLVGSGLRVIALSPEQITLEQLFVQIIQSPEGDG
nr:hypothetical protein [Anaerolineae bacterium]